MLSLVPHARTNSKVVSIAENMYNQLKLLP